MNYNVWVVPTGLHKPRLLVSEPQPVTTFLLPFVLYFPMTEPKPKIEEGSQVLLFLIHAWLLSSNILTDVFYTVLSPARHLCLIVFKKQISAHKSNQCTPSGTASFSWCWGMFPGYMAWRCQGQWFTQLLFARFMPLVSGRRYRPAQIRLQNVWLNAVGWARVLNPPPPWESISQDLKKRDSML